MSLRRLVHQYAAVGAGGAFVGWAASECLGARNGVAGLFGEALTCGLIGGVIAAGTNLITYRRGAGRRDLARSAVAGLAIGSLAATIGMSVGHALLGTLHGSRAPGWALVGGGIGAAEGLYARSSVRLRQGVLAAAIGGLAGGLPFGAIYMLLARWSEPGSRAAAFVLLGACIGAAIGLAEMIFAEAWLTVVEGQPAGGRIPIASRAVLLGRAAGSNLRFNGSGDTEIERQHVRIVRQPDGQFALEDLHSRHGTRINQRRILDRVFLKDGDVIRIGEHSIRFDRRKRRPAAGREVKRPPDSANAAESIERSPIAPHPAKIVARETPKRSPTTISACPKCNRPVPGTRPYCVFCKISF